MDGHRLALCETVLAERATSPQQVIVPRNGVLEEWRILGTEGNLNVTPGNAM